MELSVIANKLLFCQVKRKPLASSKYYFFDVSVVSALQGRPFLPGTPEFSEAFETFLMHELACCSDYVSGAPLTMGRRI